MSAILLTQRETLAAHNCEGTEQLHKIIINSLAAAKQTISSGESQLADAKQTIADGETQLAEATNSKLFCTVCDICKY